tara:strand:- start:2480 stop:4531 length:2052 start_codon:yes stop_codon:yes gene_type:complete
MKGTFYSADFIKVSDDCVKLLELNTDTGVMNTASLELESFNNLLLSESIDDVHIIYKRIHANAVSYISSSLPNSIVSCSLHREQDDSIYPVNITDADNKFILRLAYDENALFDSQYCKNKLSVHELMLENDITGAESSTPEIYYSSSNGVIFDTMDTTHNLSNTWFNEADYESNPWLPDFVGKPIYHTSNPIEFWTSGLSGSDARGYWVDNVNNKGAIRTIYDDGVEDWYVEKFYHDASNNTKASSLRYYGIVYSDSNSDIQTLFLGGYKDSAQFNYPTREEVMQFVTTNDPDNTFTEPTGSTTKLWKYPIKYFYQHSTNTPKLDSFGTRASGLLYNTKLRRENDSYDVIQNIQVSESMDSYYISGSDRTPGEDGVQIRYSGSEFPSGSYPTSSTVVSVMSHSLDYNTCIEIVTENGLTFYSINKDILTYESSSNVSRWRDVRTLHAGDHFLPTENGVEGITSCSIAILDEPSYSGLGDDARHFVYDIDVENVDTLIISASEDITSLGIVAHNPRFFFYTITPATCFAAGTEISLANGDVKNIEDVVVGEEVLGWDGTKIVPSTVTAIDHRHKVGSHADACKSLGDEPSLYTINDTGIEFTPEHPFLTKDGWKSLVPDWEQEPYKSEQEPKFLQVGDFIFKDGDWEEIKDIRIVRSDADEQVYNITVKDISSYLANGIVVHNK